MADVVSIYTDMMGSINEIRMYYIHVVTIEWGNYDVTL